MSDPIALSDEQVVAWCVDGIARMERSAEQWQKTGLLQPARDCYADIARYKAIIKRLRASASPDPASLREAGGCPRCELLLDPILATKNEWEMLLLACYDAAGVQFNDSTVPAPGYTDLPDQIKASLREAFDAGWQSAVDQTDAYGETHETPDEAYTAWITQRRQGDKP